MSRTLDPPLFTTYSGPTTVLSQIERHKLIYDRVIAAGYSGTAIGYTCPLPRQVEGWYNDTTPDVSLSTYRIDFLRP